MNESAKYYQCFWIELALLAIPRSVWVCVWLGRRSFSQYCGGPGGRI